MSSTETKAFPCDDCEKSYSHKADLDRHRESAHGVERPITKKQRTTAGGAKTQADLAKAHLGLCIGIVTFSNPGVLANVAAVDLLQKQSEEWAAATYAVARQDERIMRTIESAMRAGVWAAFFAQTAGSVLTVAAMSGRITVPYGAAVFLVPDLAELLVQAQPPAANGKDPADA